jgi:integrase
MMEVSLGPLREGVSGVNRQTLYLQLWHGYWRVRKPVPKLLIPIIGKGQYLTRSLQTANFNEAKRLAPAVLAEFNNIIEQARLRFERAACRDATLAELAHLDTLSSDQLLRQSPAVLDNLCERLDLNPPQVVANGSKVMPFKTIISEWAKERKVAPPGERSFTTKAERFITFIREHHRAADADDMARVSPEEVIDYKNELLKTDLSHDTIGNHLAALRTLFRYAKRNRKIPFDPMVDIVFRAKSDGRAKRLPFSPQDRERVLQAALASDDPVIKWANLLAGYQGMRLSEAIEADCRDVEILDDGLVVFHIRLDHRVPGMRLKNKTSIRSLPIHSAVLNGGFLDYWKSVVAAGGGQLFPQVTLNRDGRKSTNASRVLGEWLRKVVKITDPRFVFHSHRHSVKSILRNHPENPRVDLVDKILGHVGGKDDSGRDNGSSNAANGYGVFELRAMQRIIELIPAASPGVPLAAQFSCAA